MEDHKYYQLLEYLQGDRKEGKKYMEWAEQFTKKGGQVFKGDKRLIPRSQVLRIISIFHDLPTATHQSKDAVTEQIRKRYIWDGMYKDVEEYVKTCYECQMRGGPKKNNPIRMIPPMDLFQKWGIDIVGPLPTTEDGNRYIVVAMDYFSRWPEARPLRHANATSVATFIYKEIICRYGPPKVIQSDQGTHFVNQVIEQLTERFRIRHSLSSAYHPQSNGLVERFNRTLCEGIAKVADTVLDWDTLIQPVLFAYRTKKLRITNATPYELVYGVQHNLPMDDQDDMTYMGRILDIMEGVLQLRTNAKRAMRKAQKKIEEKFQEKGTQFQKGDLVLYFKKAEAMRHETKLENKWKEPYTVTQVLNKGAYKIFIDGRELPKTVNGNLLKKYHNREHYEPIVIIEEKVINKVRVSEGTAKVNMLTTEEILEKISKNIKKKSKSSKRNYYRLERKIIEENEKVNLHAEQKMSARRTYNYYRIG